MGYYLDDKSPQGEMMRTRAKIIEVYIFNDLEERINEWIDLTMHEVVSLTTVDACDREGRRTIRAAILYTID